MTDDATRPAGENTNRPSDVPTNPYVDAVAAQRRAQRDKVVAWELEKLRSERDALLAAALAAGRRAGGEGR